MIEQFPSSPERYVPSSPEEQDIPLEWLPTNNHLFIDTERPIATEDNYAVTAELQLAKSGTFYILDVRHSPSDFESGRRMPFGEYGMNIDPAVQYLVVNDEFDPYVEEPRGYKGIQLGKRVWLGRAHYQDRFTYGKDISRDHAVIVLDQEGRLSARDNSTNGTAIRCNGMAAEKQDPFQVRLAAKRVSHKYDEFKRP
jgi:hypothetical protein